MLLLSSFALYRPATDEEEELSRAAHTEMRHYIQTCDSTRDLESTGFSIFCHTWGEKFRRIGAADTAAQEAVWNNAEQYLALRELYSVVVKAHPFPDPVRLAAENLMAYFNVLT